MNHGLFNNNQLYDQTNAECSQHQRPEIGNKQEKDQPGIEKQPARRFQRKQQLMNRFIQPVGGEMPFFLKKPFVIGFLGSGAGMTFR